jgi:hypothetical protein
VLTTNNPKAAKAQKSSNLNRVRCKRLEKIRSMEETKAATTSSCAEKRMEEVRPNKGAEVKFGIPFSGGGRGILGVASIVRGG